LVKSAVRLGHRGVTRDEEDDTGGIHPGLVLKSRHLGYGGAEQLAEHVGVAPVVLALALVVTSPCWGGHRATPMGSSA
jgi:hypothetical protein